MVAQQGVTSFGLDYDAKTGVIVKAGSLAGLQPGAVLQMRDAYARDVGILADLILRDVGLDRSFAEIVRVPDGGSDLIDAAIRAEGLRPEDYRERWLADRIGQFKAVQIVPGANGVLRIALPTGVFVDQSSQAVGRINDALVLLAPTIPLKVVPSTADADIRLVIRGTRLEIVAGRGANPEANDRSYSLPLASFSVGDLAGALKQIAKATRILSIAKALSAQKASSEMSVTLAVDRATPTESSEFDCPDGTKRALPVFQMLATGPDAPIPRIGQCDAVRIDIRNGGAVALDVSPFYLDPQGRVFYLRGYTDGNWFGLRVPPGESRSVNYVEDLRGEGQGAVPAGAVFLVFLAIEADPDSLFAKDFRHLEGDLPQVSVSRGGFAQGASILETLRPAGAAIGTRGKAPAVVLQAIPRAAIIALKTGLVP
jgi:hypothetical protein